MFFLDKEGSLIKGIGSEPAIAYFIVAPDISSLLSIVYFTGCDII